MRIRTRRDLIEVGRSDAEGGRHSTISDLVSGRTRADHAGIAQPNVQVDSSRKVWLRGCGGDECDGASQQLVRSMAPALAATNRGLPRHSWPLFRSASDLGSPRRQLNQQHARFTLAFHPLSWLRASLDMEYVDSVYRRHRAQIQC